MSRRQRQLAELRDLCCCGAVARAIDLAFEHFAHFGSDADIVDMLAAALERTGPPADVRGRFRELRRWPEMTTIVPDDR
jgi:hypothetical protein